MAATFTEEVETVNKSTDMATALNWQGPHTVKVPRTEQGFGFTLRHFIVYPPESAVSAQFKRTSHDLKEVDQVDGATRKKTRLSSLEPMDTIFVRHVKENGPAHQAGLNTGDRIVSVNGETLRGKTYSQVITLIQSTNNTLQLLVVPKDEDILQMTYQHATSNQGREAYTGCATDIPVPPHQPPVSRLTRMQTASYAALRQKDAANHDHALPRSTSLPPTKYQTEYNKGLPTNTNYHKPRSSSEILDSKRARTSNLGNIPETGQYRNVLSHGSETSSSAGSNFSIQNSVTGVTGGFEKSKLDSHNIAFHRDYENLEQFPNVDADRQDYQNLDDKGSSSSLSSHGSGYIVREPRHVLQSTHRTSSGYNQPRESEADTKKIEEQNYRRKFDEQGEYTTQESHSISNIQKTPPVTPPRVSSKTITLAHMQQRMDKQATLEENTLNQLYGSNLERQAQENLRRSRENLVETENKESQKFATHNNIMLRSAGPDLFSENVSAERTFQLRQSKTTDNIADKLDSSPVHRTTVTYRKSRTTPGLVSGTSDTNGDVSRGRPYNPNRGSRYVPVEEHASIMTSQSSDQPDSGLYVTLSNDDAGVPNATYSNITYIEPTSPVTATTTTTVSTTGVRFLPAYKTGYEVAKPHVRIQKRYTKSKSDGTLSKERPIVHIHQSAAGYNEVPPGGEYQRNTLTYSLRFKEQPNAIDNMAAPPSSASSDFVSQNSPRTTISSISEGNVTQQNSDFPKHIKASITTKSGHIDIQDPKHISIAIRRNQPNENTHTAESSDAHRIITSSSPSQSVNIYVRGKDSSQPSSSYSSSQENSCGALVTTSFLSENIHEGNYSRVPSTSDYVPSQYMDYRDISNNSQNQFSSDSSTGVMGSLQFSDSQSHSTDYTRTRSSDSIGSLQSPDRSPGRDQFLSNSGSTEDDRKRGQKACRQPSYLNAMHAPMSKGQPLHSSSPNSFANRNTFAMRTLPKSWGSKQRSLHESRPGIYSGLAFTFNAAVACTTAAPDLEETPSSCSITTATTSSFVVSDAGSDYPEDCVIRRQRSADELSDLLVPLGEECQYEVKDQSGAKIVRRTSYLMATGHDHHHHPVRSPTEDTIPEAPSTAEQFQTPPKAASNIKKLKNFFGERTPRIVEATERKSSIASSSTSSDSPMSPVLQDIVKEGVLNCKMAITDGKKASDRSWKPLWSVLRGHALYLFKDRKDASVSPLVAEEQPISVKSSIVDIAYDYTKKKHVFRLTTFNGSEYLFQAENDNDMLEWIKGIQTNNNPDEDSLRVASTELILRKTAQLEQSARTPTQQQASKGTKKLSTLSFRNKSPAGGHSPNFKHRKPSNDDTSTSEKESGKSKTWRGKMAKSLKRFHSSSGGAITEVEEVTGMFGVSLEDSLPCAENEFVPLVVEMCCSIVEDRGLEFTGIYRVPGNTAAVTMLQEELNKGNISAENEKWSDVNVVSSLLKSFFRKLPDPLITEDLYQSFIKANKIDNPERRMLTLKKLLNDLPEHNYETFKYLARHLNKVASYGHLNKMDSRNLAIVFGPTLVRAKDNNMVTLVTDMSDQCRIVESVITHYDWIFGSWDEDVNVPIDLDNPDNTTSPVSGMNDILTRIAKNEDNESMTSAASINPKDIVSSIIQAANKKIKKKEKEKKPVIDDLDVSGECGFSERNIDEEVAARKLKIQTHETNTTNDVAMTKETSLTDETRIQRSMVETVELNSGKRDGTASGPSGKKTIFLAGRKISECSEVPSVATDFSDSSGSRATDSILSDVLLAFQQSKNSTNWIQEQSQDDYLYRYNDSLDTRPDVHQDLGKLTERKSQLERKEESKKPEDAPSLNVDHSNYIHPPVRSNLQPPKTSRNDPQTDHDVEVMYFGSKSSGLSRLEISRRIEYEAQILRAKDAEHEREQEKRDLERQKIELELQKTKQELENDDINLEYLDGEPSELAFKIFDITSKINDLNKTDSSSVTSDYSTTSSTNVAEVKPTILIPKSSMSDYSSNASSPSIRESRNRVSAVSKSSSTPIKPTNLSETKTNLAKSDKPESAASSDINKLYGKTRHTSLYSMGPSVASRINAFEEKKPGKPAVYLRSASASQIKVALSSTKRHSLESSNAIYENVSTNQMSASSRGRSRLSSNSNSEALQKKLNLKIAKTDMDEHPNSPFRRIGSFQGRRGSLDSLRDFYDPTNQRASYASSTSEDGHDLLSSITATFDQKLKILVNPRYKLNSNNQVGVGNSLENLPKSETACAQERPKSIETSHLPESNKIDQGLKKSKSEAGVFASFRDPSLHRLSHGEAKIGIASRFERTRSSSNSNSNPSNASNFNNDWYHKAAGQNLPLTKLEKTDTNWARKVSELGLMTNDTCNNDKSANIKSSPKVRHRNKKKDLKRRHTVGGAKDFEQFKEYLTNQSNQVDTAAMSAWDRLQPKNKIQPDEKENPKSLKGWIEQERLRSGELELVVKKPKTLIDIDIASPKNNTVKSGKGTPKYLSKESRSRHDPKTPMPAFTMESNI